MQKKIQKIKKSDINQKKSDFNQKNLISSIFYKKS